MYKNYVGWSIASGMATWGFFALLLDVLRVSDSGLNAMLLTILLFLAIFSCPVMNPKICRFTEAPKKKK